MKTLLWIVAMLTVTAVVGGCLFVDEGSRPTAGPSTAPPTAPPKPNPATPTASPAVASPTLSPSAQATETPSAPVPPPIAEIQPPSGNEVPGQQGSWCYDGACGDVPAFPKEDLPLLALGDDEEGLAFFVADSHPFSYWSASYAADPDAAYTNLASGGEYFDPDLSAATPGPMISTFEFEQPPSGDWLLSVSLQFGDRGDAVYSWHALVP